jgi:hypothetical protein
MSDTTRREGSGKSPTKFMERKPAKPEEKQEGQPEFINDDLDALENQEKQDDEEIQTPPQTPPQQWSKPGKKGDEKPNPRKFQDPEETDSSSEDKGDTAS